MLIGRTGAGKTSFCQAVHHMEVKYKKTQSIEIVNNDVIDTPGEYVENRGLYRALMVSGADADLIVLLQDCTDTQTYFAPAFTSMFAKPSIGLVSKIDKAVNEEQIKEAKEKLEIAGCDKVFLISNTENIGIEEVEAYLSNE